jgi:hypothetical protein
MKIATLLVILFAYPFLLSGCATSSIESRRSERMSAYTAMKPEFQRLAEHGRISVGMPADAVYIAWGKPSEVVQSASASTETWRYYGTRARSYQYWDYGPHYPPGNGFLRHSESDFLNYNYALPYLERDYYPERYLRAEVTFQNGIVEGWIGPNTIGR